MTISEVLWLSALWYVQPKSIGKHPCLAITLYDSIINPRVIGLGEEGRSCLSACTMPEWHVALLKWSGTVLFQMLYLLGHPEKPFFLVIE